MTKEMKVELYAFQRGEKIWSKVVEYEFEDGFKPHEINETFLEDSEEMFNETVNFGFEILEKE
jgi:hypothetical protein